jgi:site-specific DNA-cytosine methylase
MPGRGGEDDANLIFAIQERAVSASAGHHGHSSPRGDGSDNLVLANPLGSNQTGGFRFDLDGDTYIPDIAYTIAAREAKGVSLLESQTNYIAQNGVRRLTPLECERLQGWPDDHTRWTANGREISDSVRYRMIGNGVVAPVAEWIGRRIVAMEKARLAAGLGDGAE